MPAPAPSGRVSLIRPASPDASPIGSTSQLIAALRPLGRAPDPCRTDGRIATVG
jgi:hypothetical protein